MKFTSDRQVAKRKVLHIVFAASRLALVLSAAIAPASAQSSAYAENVGYSASIEGSWIFRIALSLAQQPIATFNSLISFGAGVSPRVSPGLCTLGQRSPKGGLECEK